MRFKIGPPKNPGELRFLTRTYWLVGEEKPREEWITHHIRWWSGFHIGGIFIGVISTKKYKEKSKSHARD